MLREYKFKLDNSKFQITDEGYLVCQGACARTGIQNYNDEKGGIIKEFRSEKEVFSSDSLDTHKMVPITMYHPGEKVNSENFKDYTVGVTGSSPKKDSDFVINEFKIMEKSIVDDILKRKERGESIEISMGYDCDVIEEKGMFNDQTYDAIQTKIRINHAALCDQGTARAGRGAKLRFDSEELTECLLDQERELQTIIVSKDIAKNSTEAKKIAEKFGVIKKVEEKENTFRFRQRDPGLFVDKSFKTFKVPGKPGVSLVFGTLKGKIDMKKFNKDSIHVGDFHMDSINLDYDESSEPLVSRLSAKLDESVEYVKKLISEKEKLVKDNEQNLKTKSGEHDKVRAELDQLKADKEKLDSELKELSDVNSERVQKMIESKALLKSVADHFKLDIEGKSDKDIKIAVIKAVSPECKLDKESDGYIDGRFDLIVEKAKTDKKSMKDNVDSLSEFTKKSKTEEKKEDARQNFIDRSSTAWKTGSVFETKN
jgi:hypothetical protein